MTPEELLKLSRDITQLQEIIGVNSPFALVNEQETGATALLFEGKYLNIRGAIRTRMKQEPSLRPSCERALELVDEVDEGLARYIREYGKIPSELIMQ